MSIWRPVSEIRVKALGLHWRAGRLLAAEVHDDLGGIVGVRPLGGSVEFGERAEAAVLREFKEELGVEIRVSSGPIVMENLFAHQGIAGHEVLFLFTIELPLGAFAEQESIRFQEDNGTAGVARWYDLNALDSDDGPTLLPKGLKPLLLDASQA